MPTDFSAGAQQALERALRLPLGPRSKLTLLHVLPDDIPGKLRKEAFNEAERNMAKTLAAVQPLIEEGGLAPRQVVTDVVEGNSVQQIVKRAHTVEADVICMGRHGRGSLLDVLIGSTARKVVKAGDVPVLLVRSAAREAYRSVLVAVDLTLGSPKVIKAARPYLQQSTEVEVLYASSVPYEDYVVMSASRSEEFRQAAMDEAAQELKALVTKTGLKATPRVLGGDPRMVIVEEAKAQESELIVLGTHGRKGLKKLVLGSVAEWVLSHASCDVLVCTPFPLAAD